MLQTCIREVSTAHDRQALYKNSEQFIVMIQARMRGYLARRRFHELKSFLSTMIPTVVKIQVSSVMVNVAYFVIDGSSLHQCDKLFITDTEYSLQFDVTWLRLDVF